MNRSETKGFWLKISFVVSAILLPVVLPFLAPSLGIKEGGKISLNGMQVLYAVLSAEIAVAVYVWGVGNWSRFEPPKIPSASPNPQMSSPSQASPPKPTQPGSSNSEAPGRAPGGQPTPQGGH